MKRLVLLAMTLLFSFSANSQGRRPLPRVLSYPAVTLCELARDPDLYHGMTVRVVGVADSPTGSTLILRSAGVTKGQCGTEEAVFVVRPARAAGMGGLSRGFFNETGVHPAMRGRAAAKVEVVGKFDKGVKGLTDCFRPRFSIEADSVKQLSPAIPLFLE